MIFPYAASSISFNTLLLTAYLKQLPTEIDEAAVIDGCNIWQLMVKVILPMAKPVIATIVIFNVLYIWNEYPYASVMLKDVSDYTLSMGASFFKGNYTVDYGGIVASSLMIIVPGRTHLLWIIPEEYCRGYDSGSCERIIINKRKGDLYYEQCIRII